MRDWLGEVMEFLAKGELAKARETGAEGLREMDRVMARLRREAAALRELLDLRGAVLVGSVGAGGESEQAAGHQAEYDTSTSQGRNRAFVAKGVELGRRQVVFHVRDAARELNEEGIVLPPGYGNLPARIGTVLGMSSRFRKLGGGRWEFLGEEPEGN